MCVVVTVGTRPMRAVAGATRDSTASASGPGLAEGVPEGDEVQGAAFREAREREIRIGVVGVGLVDGRREMQQAAPG